MLQVSGWLKGPQPPVNVNEMHFADEHSQWQDYRRPDDFT